MLSMDSGIHGDGFMMPLEQGMASSVIQTFGTWEVDTISGNKMASLIYDFTVLEFWGLWIFMSDY